MIRRIEALNYRCLRDVDMGLEPFQILVGPNATGKTTFLDVVAFLGDLVSQGLEYACQRRTQNFRDFLWGGEGRSFELAIELEIPEKFRKVIAKDSWTLVRYEVSIGLGVESDEVEIQGETVLMKEETQAPQQLRLVFPQEPDLRPSLASRSVPGVRTVVKKVPGGNDNFYSEVNKEPGKGWKPSFKLGVKKSALGNLPADESNLPVSTWLKGILSEGVSQFILNSQLIKQASPPGQPKKLMNADGSNLPWVVDNLKRTSEDNYSAWVQHLRTALPDIVGVHSILREDIMHRFLVLEYEGGLRIPSWMASDGTLRLLALTLPTYLPGFSGVYLIEEPENGIHPRAVETMFESLSSVYGAQIILATHSPVILGLADRSQILCFSKAPSGAADIVRGSSHPGLRDWKEETSLGLLFAGGVLG